MQYNLLLDLDQGLYVSEEDLTLNDLREFGIGIAAIIIQVFSIVTFIRWFRRAYFNTHSRALNPAYEEGWAAGSWFVPILNLFRPYQIMKEIDKETSNLIAKEVKNRLQHTKTLLDFGGHFGY